MAQARVPEGANAVGMVDVRAFLSLLALAIAGGCGGKANGHGGTDAGVAAAANTSTNTAHGGKLGSGANSNDISGGADAGNAPNKATSAGGTVHAAGGASPAGSRSAGGSHLTLDTAPSGGVSGQGGSQPRGGVLGTADTNGGGAVETSGSTSRGGTATGGSAGSGQAGSTGGRGTGGSEQCAAPTATPGTPITLNDDGVWSWFQDERAIVDTEANKLIIGSIACKSRNGDVEATLYDLAGSGAPQRSTLGSLNPDESNAPALIKVSTGKYLAVYTTHNDDCFSYYNVYQNGAWGEQGAFDWGPVGCPTSRSKTVSYSNLWQMPGKIYNFVRSYETSPNLITTTDGSGFMYAGRLTGTPLIGYVGGYYKYWGNSVDRIDFVGTEAHPRDNDNSLYHGYVKATGDTIRSYDSFGNEQGTIDQASQNNSPELAEFTKIFATGTTVGVVKLTHLWNHDIMRYDDGTIVVLGQGRVAGTDTDDPDKRFIYLRFDGSEWHATYLVRGGRKLLVDEQDYTGLSAIHPNDPRTIYVSTPYDPRDDKTQTTKRELWRGTTCDQGKTFTWTQITKDSTEENVHPVVPYWPGGKTALLWMKGYTVSASVCRSSIVGLIMDGS